MSTISTNLSVNSTQDPVDPTAIVQKNTLDQNDFLKLLVTQMSSQDPMNPMTDTSFVAQMAQFTSLQNSVATQSDMALLQANSMIGRDVSLKDNQGSLVAGNVAGVQIQDGAPQIIVNGQPYDVKSVITIAAPQPSN